MTPLIPLSERPCRGHGRKVRALVHGQCRQPREGFRHSPCGYVPLRQAQGHRREQKPSLCVRSSRAPHTLLRAGLRPFPRYAGSHNAVFCSRRAAGALCGAGVRPLVPLAPDAPGQLLDPVFLLAACDPGGWRGGRPADRAAGLRGRRAVKPCFPSPPGASAVLRRESRLHRAPGSSLHGGGAGRRCRSTGPGHQSRLAGASRREQAGQTPAAKEKISF